MGGGGGVGREHLQSGKRYIFQRKQNKNKGKKTGGKVAYSRSTYSGYEYS